MNRQTWAALAATLTLITPLASHAQAAVDPVPAPSLAPPAPPVEPTAAPAPMAPPAPGEKPQRLPHDKFAQVDTNRDGVISRDEAAAAPQLAGKFDEIDTDRDGRVAPAELKAYAKTHRGGAKGAFSKMDGNGDGVITRDEVAANPKLARKFDAADLDHDGRVTPDEARAAKSK
ncbi:EF-hand domain-containing protein [Ideonella sp.]|uniref:EF-hand domain-containing protein n=1 Tax=Ideonella sp. TaxID=1929293 RepID=UPI0035B15603